MSHEANTIWEENQRELEDDMKLDAMLEAGLPEDEAERMLEDINN